MDVRAITSGLLGVFALACSSSTDDTGPGISPLSASGGTPGMVPTGSPTGAPTGAPTGGPPAGTSGGSSFMMDDGQDLSDGGSCLSDSQKPEPTPLDIYIMFDLSASMSCPASMAGEGLWCPGDPNPRFVPVRDAVNTFIADPQMAGISVGLGYFGNNQLGNANCAPQGYNQPDVQMAPLPGNQGALSGSLGGVGPTGETPTGPAIRGACEYTTQYKAANPAHTVVLLLVTDGVPETPITLCPNVSLPDAVQAATECANNSGIPVYVLGVGAALQNLSQIATAGGTQQAYLVESGDVAAQVLQALQTIRGEATIQCEYRIPAPPPGQVFDPTKVNVRLTSPTGQQTIYNVPSINDCNPAEGGWFYDDPVNPTKIQLCGSTCDAVTIQTQSSLDLALGCETEYKPR